MQPRTIPIDYFFKLYDKFKSSWSVGFLQEFFLKFIQKFLLEISHVF